MISDFYQNFENDDTTKLRPIRCKRVSQIPESKVIIGRVEACLKQTVCSHVPLPVAPIGNIDGYVWGMNFTKEDEKHCREKYTPEPDIIVEQVEKLIVPSDPLHVFTTLKVLKSGKVKIKFSVPMEPVYEYQKKFKLAPLEVRIKAASGFGYPDEILTQMIKNHDNEKSNKQKVEDFIDVIFGKSINAKVSKPKVKSIQESLNAKFKKKPLKKY